MPASTDASQREPHRIWDGVGQSFDTRRLREAMLIRGFTVETLAAAAGVSLGTTYKVLHGKPVRLRTARLLLEALANVQPTLHLSFPLTDD
jgi:transcriptional regulator with XRE-family HTH domain